MGPYCWAGDRFHCLDSLIGIDCHWRVCRDISLAIFFRGISARESQILGLSTAGIPKVLALMASDVPANASAATHLIYSLDKGLDDILAGWNHYTTVLVLGLILYALLLLFTYAEPDVHPFLLGRQASASSVRMPGESAVYRSLETPQGYPLRSGLNVKDADAPKWSAGRDGDLRDVWKQALKPLKDGKDGAKQTLKITSVLGKRTAQFTPKGLMKDMNVLGRHLQSGKTQRVALYLPNSAELLVTLFGELCHED